MSLHELSFPEGFIKSVSSLLKDGLDAFLESFSQAPRRALRYSARRELGFINACTRPVPWARDAWYIDQDMQPGAHPLHWAGAYYIQEPSAMAAVSALHPSPGDRVLDLCAAPGGKACQLADELAGEGILVANDPVFSRAVELSRNIERMGIRNALVTANQPEQLAEKFPCYFDKILVDAPCSGEGMFRKDPLARSQWTPALPAFCAERQGRILDSAAMMLRPGGKMVYSTCTFNLVENENVIEGFLMRRPEFCLLPFVLDGLPGAAGGMLRIWPHQAAGEGHFVALLERRGEGEGCESATVKPFTETQKQADLCRAVNDALPDWSAQALYASAVHASKAVMLPPDCPDVQGLQVLRLGLHLGSLQGKTPRPDHALALAAQPRICVSVDEPEAQAYRKGQPLDVRAGVSGWAAPCISGWPLGWGKASDGSLKNHYPKGLRVYS